MITKKIALLFSLLFASSSFLLSMSFFEQPKALKITFATNVEFRKSQHVELGKKLALYKKRSDDADKTFAALLKTIAIEHTDTIQKLKKASEAEAEFLNKKNSILNDRKQNIFDFQQLWRTLLEDINQHIKLIEAAIEYLQTKLPELKPAYSWKEFRDAQMQLAEFVARIEGDKSRRENVKKQKTAAYEKIGSLEKQYENITQERDQLILQIDKKKPGTTDDAATLKQKGENLTQEIEALKEKIDHTKLFMEKLDIESKRWDDVIDLNMQQLQTMRERIAQVENRLVLDYTDIENAKTEWRNEVQNALMIKEELNQQRDPKKQEREKVLADLDLLNKKIDSFKTKPGREPVPLVILKSEGQRLSALLQVIEKELLVLDAKKDLAQVRVNEKELQYNMIEMRYKMQIDAENIDSLIAAFQNKSDLSRSLLKTYKDMRTEAISSLIEANQMLDRIKVLQEKFKPQNIDREKEHAIRAIFSLLEETKIFLNVQLNVIQSFLAVNAELLSFQEKIINQYDLLLSDLDVRYKTHTIWKRSPRAISPEALARSAFEAESFFTNLYWETPSHIKPSALWHSTLSYTLSDLLYILLLLILLLLLFFGLRFSLFFLTKKGHSIVDHYQGRTRFLYLHLALVFLNLILDHFGLLFAWTFCLFCINNPDSFFVSSLVVITRYHGAILFLFSIPLFMYLAGHLIDQLKDLNKKLSFFFFAESFQTKFIMLVTILSYATAVLLPLRHAVMTYMPTTHSDFATVVLAAYSLTALLVLLFFFSKEDVLKFIPSHNTFFIWLKRKIDKHYYPVFFFFVGLLILSNPYIGYSNMAWFLAFALPSSTFLLFALFKIHLLVRKYAIFLFIKEEDEDLIDKFEHAKAYYGFFVIFSFLLLLFFTSIFLLRIWGVQYSPADVWKALAERWVLRVGVDSRLGAIELMIFTLFIAAGFFISSLLHKFILTRLFEILRTEPGTQNTITRMCHYTIVFLAIILGFNSIHLEHFIFWVGATLGIGLGWALKDIAADLVAGFFVLIERPIEIGNYIQIDNVQGTVHKIAGRSTTIITARNHSVIIPNKDLVTKWIDNWGHGRFAVGFEMNVRVAHKSDPELVKKLLGSIIQANPFVLKVPGVVARLEEIEENSLYFLTRAFVSARRVKEQWEIAAALRMEILKAFRQNNIQLAAPTRILQVSGKNDVKKNDDENDLKAIEIKFNK